MPRVKPLTETERKNRALLGMIAMGMANEGKTNEEMAKSMGMSYGTWMRRKRTPEEFTVRELRKMKAILPGIEIAI